MAVPALRVKFQWQNIKLTCFCLQLSVQFSVLLSAERRLLEADHLMSNESLSDDYKIETAG